MQSVHLQNRQPLLHPATHDPSLDRGRSKLGLLYAMAIPVSAGVATVRGINLGSLNYSGLIWMLLLAAGLLLVLTEKALHRDTKIHFPVSIWGIWFGIVALSLLWCEQVTGRNIQDAMQIAMPFLVGVAVSMFVRTESELRLFLKCFAVTLGLLSICVAAAKLGLVGSTAEGLSISPRVLGLTAALIGAVMLAQWPSHRILPIVGWGICLLLTISTGSRTATAALLLLPIIHPGYRNPLARLVALGAVAIASVALFYSSTFQERFFYSGGGTLTDVLQGNFLGFGRFYAWPIIWEEAWTHPILGAGVGSTFDYVPTIWPGMNHVHNDYLRIGYECGLLGLVIFVAIVAWQLMTSHRRLTQSQGVLRNAWVAVFLGWCVFLITACTDNPLIYNLWFMNPLFALMGAAYGVSAAHDRQEELQDEIA